MTIAIVIIIIIAISFFTDQKYLKTYFIFAALVLSMLYCFAQPEGDADYYRHLVFLRSLKGISWSDILGMRVKNYGYYITDLYVPRYLVFCIYSKFMAYLPENLYVVPVCFVVYLIPIKFLDCECVTKDKLIYVLSYSFYLMGINYIGISAIRNTFVAVFFCFVLYEELVEKKNKIICWICYYLLCLIHAYGFMLLFFRLLILISNRFIKLIIAAIALMAYGILTTRATLVTSLLNKIGGGFLTSLINLSVERFFEYSTYVSDDRWKLKAVTLFLYCLGAIFIIIYCKSSGKMRTDRNAGYHKMVEFYAYLQLFIISAYSQYDIFMRGEAIITPLIGVFVIRFLDESISIRGFRIGYRKSATLIGFIIALAFMVGSFVAKVNLQYKWANNWWV